MNQMLTQDQTSELRAIFNIVAKALASKPACTFTYDNLKGITGLMREVGDEEENSWQNQILKRVIDRLIKHRWLEKQASYDKTYYFMPTNIYHKLREPYLELFSG